MNYLFLDNGFEEIEAITVVDLLRRAGIPLTTVSITGKPMVLGAHNVAENNTPRRATTLNPAIFRRTILI